MRISDYIDADLLDRFEFYNYNHAIEIITQAFPKEWSDVVECLRKLDITTDDLREAGGNETKIPKKFDDVLYPCGWREIRISGDLHIKFYPRQADLLAMRTYYDCDIVSAGIIVTRSQELNDVFKTVYDFDKNSHSWKPIMRKYGASTTWMGKLLYRLESRRNGGCPVLAIGIKKNCVSDWEEGYMDEHATGNI